MISNKIKTLMICALGVGLIGTAYAESAIVCPATSTITYNANTQTYSAPGGWATKNTHPAQATLLFANVSVVTVLKSTGTPGLPECLYTDASGKQSFSLENTAMSSEAPAIGDWAPLCNSTQGVCVYTCDAGYYTSVNACSFKALPSAQ